MQASASGEAEFKFLLCLTWKSLWRELGPAARGAPWWKVRWGKGSHLKDAPGTIVFAYPSQEHSQTFGKGKPWLLSRSQDAHEAQRWGTWLAGSTVAWLCWWPVPPACGYLTALQSSLPWPTCQLAQLSRSCHYKLKSSIQSPSAQSLQKLLLWPQGLISNTFFLLALSILDGKRKMKLMW